MARGQQKIKKNRRYVGGVFMVIAGVLIGSGIMMGRALLSESGSPDAAIGTPEVSVSERVVDFTTTVQETPAKPVEQPIVSDVVDTSELDIELSESTESSELASIMSAEYYTGLADASARLVLIDISEQKVRAFEDEDIVMESLAVTGLKDCHDTQLGIYAVVLKQQNYTMHGSYGRARVDYWMRFNNPYAQGLHDASWRNEFGGEIYVTNGSHGCVNLPSDFVAELYDFVEVGTPVIVQD